MRFRVSFESREPVELEANEIEFTGAGGIVFQQVITEERVNPQDFRQRVIVPVAKNLIRGWSSAARWTDVEPLDESEEGAAPAPLEEVYAR